MPLRDQKYIEDKLNSLRRALEAAYTGDSEYGSFFRRGQHGEYVPSVFLTFNELRAAVLDKWRLPEAAAAPETPRLNIRQRFIDGLDGAELSEADHAFVVACLDQAIAAPTERPDDARGRLILNSYGRECFNAGYEAALKVASPGADPTPAAPQEQFPMPQQGDERDCPECKGSPHKQRFVVGKGWVHHANYEWTTAKHGPKVMRGSNDV